MAEPKRYDLAEVIRERYESHPDVEIALSDGSLIHIKAPQSWGAKMMEGVTGEDSLAVYAQAFVEEDGAERFEADGGSLFDFSEIVRRTTGVELPQSSASTGS